MFCADALEVLITVETTTRMWQDGESPCHCYDYVHIYSELYIFNGIIDVGIKSILLYYVRDKDGSYLFW